MKRLMVFGLFWLGGFSVFSQSFPEILDQANRFSANDHYAEALPFAQQAFQLAETDQQKLDALTCLAEIEMSRGNSNTGRIYLFQKENILRSARQTGKEEYYNNLIDIIYSFSDNNLMVKADSVLKVTRNFDNSKEKRKLLNVIEIELLMDGAKWEEAEEELNSQNIYYDFEFVKLQLRLNNHWGDYNESEDLIMSILGDEKKETQYHKESFLELLPEILELLELKYGYFEDYPQYSSIDSLMNIALQYVDDIYPGDSLEYYSVLTDIISGYLNTGDIEKAGEILSSTMVADNNIEMSERNLNWLFVKELQTEWMEKSGDYVHALWNYEEIIRTAAELFGKESISYQYYLHNKAFFLAKLGQFDEAEAIAVNSLNIISGELGPQSSLYASIVSLLGNIQFRQNRYTESLNRISEAISINEENGVDCNPCYSNLLVALAEVYEKQGEIRKSEETCLKAFEYLNKNMSNPNDDPIYNSFRVTLGNFYVRALAGGNAGKLQYYGQKEITTFEGWKMKFNGSNPEQPIRSLALEFLKQGREFMSNYYGPSNTEVTQIDLDLARYYWTVNSRLEAGAWFKKGLDDDLRDIQDFFPYMSEKEKSDFYKTTSDHFNSFNAYLVDENNSYWIDNNYYPKIFYVDPQYAKIFTGEMGEDSINYLIENVTLDNEPKVKVSDLHLGLLLNYRIQTKAILLNEATGIRKRIYSSGDSTLISKYRRWESLRELSAKLIEEKQTPRMQHRKDSLASILKYLEREISIQSEVFKGELENQQITWQDIRNKLKPGEAAVEVIRFNSPVFYKSGLSQYKDSIYYAFVIINSSTIERPELIMVKNGYEMENKFLKNYQNSIRFKTEDSLSYGIYWKFLQKKLGRYDRIYFSPDGVYNLINLQTLKDKNIYLIQKSDIRLLTNLKDLLVDVSESTGSRGAYLFGNPDFNSPMIEKPGITEEKEKPEIREERSIEMESLFRSGISPLPGTGKEVKSIASALENYGWKDFTFTGQQATEEELKSISLANILHIATHGFFLKAPSESSQESPLLRSGLLLAGAGQIENDKGREDGVLTSFEAMNLNLNTTKLVVLSACETGLGEVVDGEGVYGLQRALKIAGARQIIMSLWKVNDQVTMELMQSFYTNYLETGNANEALRASQLEIMAKYKDPYYWGPFVITGY